MGDRNGTLERSVEMGREGQASMLALSEDATLRRAATCGPIRFSARHALAQGDLTRGEPARDNSCETTSLEATWFEATWFEATSFEATSFEVTSYLEHGNLECSDLERGDFIQGTSFKEASLNEGIPPEQGWPQTGSASGKVGLKRGHPRARSSSSLNEVGIDQDRP